MKETMRRAGPVAVIALFLTAAFTSGLWQQYQYFLQSPLAIGEAGMVLTVERGASMS